MPWDRNQPTDPKYRSAEHRRRRAAMVAELKRVGYLICSADVCLFGDRTITNPNGNQHDGLHAGHEDNGVEYRGPQHRACNLRDGAVRGRARQNAPTRWEL